MSTIELFGTAVQAVAYLAKAVYKNKDDPRPVLESGCVPRAGGRVI